MSSYDQLHQAAQQQLQDMVRVASRRGQLTGRALFTDRERAGEIFIPFVKLSESAANFLTNAAYDPTSKIPEYKVCAVRVEPAEERSLRRWCLGGFRNRLKRWFDKPVLSAA